jgi:arylsulfatase A-like enzyme
VANLLYTSRESKLTRGFVEYRDYPVSLGQLFLHCPLVRTGLVQSLLAAKERWEIRRALERFDLQTDRSPADDYIPASAITDGFLTWQAGVGGRPFFAFLNYFDAHAPYRSPAEFQARFASGNQERDSYDAAIAYLDAELDRLFTTLAARGVLARTLVVVTADHGELLGEHGLHGHANALYLPLLRVPLLLRYPPRVPGGVRVDQPVSLRDVPATILELVSGHPSELPGRSLAATWDASRKGPVNAAVSEVGRARYRNDPNYLNSDTWLQSVFDEQHHYIRSGLGKEELYAWRTDSLELTNLAGSPHAAAALQRLRITLEQALGR